MNIWFSSDFHYNHKNIVRGVSEWEHKERTRNFDTLEEHNEVLVQNINKTVKHDDVLYCLGDWSFGEKDAIIDFRVKLNCRFVYLVLGNHDKHIEKNILHREIHLRSLFENVDKIMNVKHGKHSFVLSHYAMRVWDGSHKGSIMLYGHSHGTLDAMTPDIANPTWIGDQYFIKNYRTMDVGIDTHPEFRPYSIEEVISIMDNKNVELEVDHHEKK